MEFLAYECEVDNRVDDDQVPEYKSRSKQPKQEIAVPTARKSRVYSARDALREPNLPCEWLVEDILAPGTVALLVGKPGAMKTYAMLDMLACVSAGHPWLGRNTKPRPVLFVDEESGPRRLKKRIREVLKAHAHAGTVFSYTTLVGYNLRTQAGIDLLREDAQEAGAGVIVIDALADIMPGADENAVKDVQPVFSGLRRLAEEMNLGTLLIHHTNKLGNYRGSTAMAAAVDLLLTVEKKNSPLHLRFKSEKTRDTGELTFCAEPFLGEDSFCLIEAEGTKSKSKFSAAAKHILLCLYEKGPQMTHEITANPVGCTPETVRTNISPLVHKGLVKRIDDGGTREATYDLTDKGEQEASLLLSREK